MCRLKIQFLFLLLVWGAVWPGRAANTTNSLVWNAAADNVSADIHGEPLWPLLEDIAHQTGWHIFVEPTAARNVDVKFTGLSSGEALKKLLGDLNFAYVPQTNQASQLYVFLTSRENATRAVNVEAPKTAKAKQKHIPNELLLKVKPGTDIDALAKAIGAKVIGRDDKLGLYRLQFADADAADAALGQLKANSDVALVDYNYIYDPPVMPQSINGAPVGQVSLALNPPGNSGQVIVGLVDTSIQSLGTDLDKFILKSISIAGSADVGSTDPTHATSMAETILRAMAAQGGNTSAQILPVDIYGNSTTTTSWNLILGLQAAVNGGANVVNLSLGGTTDSPILDDFVNQVLAKGVIIFAATGNSGENFVDTPAANPGVIAVAATQGNQLAPYSNYGTGTAMAFPGMSIIYMGNQAYVVQGTSPATAYATGIAAGTKSGTSMTWSQILTAMQQKFPVPAK